MYLTYAEYQLLGYNDVDAADYPNYYRAAKQALDYLTHDFYVWNSLNDDVDFRKNKFKEAVAAMIHYYASFGTTDSFALETTQGGSVTIGRTSIGNSGNSSNGSTGGSALAPIPNEVYTILAYTGLLYKGLRGVYGC